MYQNQLFFEDFQKVFKVKVKENNKTEVSLLDKLLNILKIKKQ